MKRLSVNIEDIDINGRPEVLTGIITDIDARMQEFAQETEFIKAVVVGHGGSNYGVQYNMMCEAVNAFSADIYAAADVLNDLQHQVVEFENKCHIVENEPPSASGTPNTVTFTELSANTSAFQMHTPEMIEVSNALAIYFESARETVMHLGSNRDAICAIWLDSQSKDFSEVIEEVMAIIRVGSQGLDDYKQYLDRLISVLS